MAPTTDESSPTVTFFVEPPHGSQTRSPGRAFYFGDGAKGYFISLMLLYCLSSGFVCYAPIIPSRNSKLDAAGAAAPASKTLFQEPRCFVRLYGDCC